MRKNRVLEKSFRRSMLNKRRFCESFGSETSFNEKFDELKDVAKELKEKYGEEVTDAIEVIFWAKDEEGTPCLVKGAYNYWSGDDFMSLTEVADGEYPSDFVDKLDEYIQNAPEFLNKIMAEHVSRECIRMFGLDDKWYDLQKIILDGGYDALYDAIKDKIEDDIDKDDFIYKCENDFEDGYGDELVVYGWEYAPTKQGNLFYGRSDSVKGPLFGERIDMFGNDEDISYASGDKGIHAEELEELAQKIAEGKTEPLRW